IFWNTARPSSTALTMLAKLSSSRTMSAASLATSVPAIPIAMPIWAAFRAGASFTPSPVTATIWFLFLSATFPLTPGRGDEAKHGGHGPDSRERKTLQVTPRDMYEPDLHIDTLKVKARNFR